MKKISLIILSALILLLSTFCFAQEGEWEYGEGDESEVIGQSYIVAELKDKLFYITRAYDTDMESYLYSMNIDGTKKTMVGKPLSIETMVASESHIYFYSPVGTTISRFDEKGNIDAKSFKLSDKSNYISWMDISGEWIYFAIHSATGTGVTQIYKVDHNFNSKTLVTKGEIIYNSPQINGDKIFFSEYDGNILSVYSIKVNGTQKTRLTQKGVDSDLNFITDDYLFFTSDYRNETCVFSKRLADGKTVIFEDMFSWADIKFVDKDWIYYTEFEAVYVPIYRMRHDGSDRSILVVNNAFDCTVLNNKIYFTGEDGNLWRMDLDGSNKKQL